MSRVITRKPRTQASVGRNNRRRGAALERLIAKIFSEQLGVECKRKLGQARDGGIDLEPAYTDLAIEIKCRKTLGGIYQWMRQAVIGAARGKTPVVVMRQDGGEPLVLMRLKDFMPVARFYSQDYAYTPGGDLLYTPVPRDESQLTLADIM